MHPGSEFVFSYQCKFIASHVAVCMHHQLEMVKSSGRRVQVYVAVVREVIQKQQGCPAL